MLELIRRKIRREALSADEFAEESTLFTLSTEVPRPSERRTSERLQAVLPVARLVTETANHFCRIKNISAGGLMAEAVAPIRVGERVRIELNSEQRLPGTVVWVRTGLVGIKFDSDVDLQDFITSGNRQQNVRARPPRLEVSCGATVQIGKLYHKVEVHDISLGGMKVALNDWHCTGRSVIVTIESLRSFKGKVRWYKGGCAGIVFEKPLTFEELTKWMARRLEIASLRTGAWGARR
jgi:hypothetical protein